MNKAFKRIVAGICFAVILIMLIAFEGRAIHPEDSAEGASFDVWDGFYAEEKNSIDVLLLGSSTMYRAWIPTQAYEEQGFTSYLLSNQAQPFEAVPYIIEEGLKTQNADLIVVDIKQAYRASLITYENGRIPADEKEKSEYYLSEISAPMRFSATKLKMIFDVLGEENLQTKVEWALPLLKYHENELELTANERITRLGGGANAFKSAAQSGRKAIINVKEPKILSNCRLLESDKKLIDKAWQAAAERGKKILFISSPYFPDDAQYTLLSEVGEYMRQKRYDYLDISDYRQEIGLDIKEDYYDEVHTNVFGAVKATSWLAEKIKRDYLPQKTVLSPSAEKSWKTAAKAWKEQEKLLKQNN